MNQYFGEFGGIYLPKKLEKEIKKLAHEYEKISKDKNFQKQLKTMYKEYANRPSLLYYAKNLTEHFNKPKIYLKREDLNHTGAHKINNVIGQGLIAKHLGKTKLIAETGAGQHGVATATIAAYLNLQCDIYMGTRDIKNQKSNVYKMKILGANVIPVSQGQGTLKDAVDVALNSYAQDFQNSYYLLGSVVGPHPYPTMVRNFQKIIGEEIREQILKKENRLPTHIIACVGGGSNAIGAFHNFIPNEEVKLVAIEPAGKGKDTNQHGLALQKGSKDVIHGFKTLVLKDDEGNISESYSIASGLDYPGVGPELSDLKIKGRLILGYCSDTEAINGFKLLSEIEGIIPALESAHTIGYLKQNINLFEKNDLIVINLSGRGDKDVENIYENYIS